MSLIGALIALFGVYAISSSSIAATGPVTAAATSNFTIADVPACAKPSSDINPHYYVNGPSVPELRGHVKQGGTVKVTYTLKKGCTVRLSLVAYKAPGPTFSEATVAQQVVFDSASDKSTGGSHTLRVTVPSCYFQVDFVYGPVIAHLTATHRYAVNHVNISADNGGDMSCDAAAAPEPTDEPQPTEEPQPSDTPEPTATPEPTYTPEPTATPEPTGEVQGVTAAPTDAPTGDVEAAVDTPETGDAPTSFGLGAALLIIGLGTLLVARTRRDPVFAASPVGQLVTRMAINTSYARYIPPKH